MWHAQQFFSFSLAIKSSFLIYFRSVGTFARALDCSSSVKQPSLHMSAAAASRDITLVSFGWLITLVCSLVLIHKPSLILMLYSYVIFRHFCITEALLGGVVVFPIWISNLHITIYKGLNVAVGSFSSDNNVNLTMFNINLFSFCCQIDGNALKNKVSTKLAVSLLFLLAALTRENQFM